MFNRVRADSELSSVTTDNVAGGRLAAQHLLSLGRPIQPAPCFKRRWTR
jgi:DNA-binding LacI/PurR family transcriptional regulator